MDPIPCIRLHVHVQNLSGGLRFSSRHGVVVICFFPIMKTAICYQIYETDDGLSYLVHGAMTYNKTCPHEYSSHVSLTLCGPPNRQNRMRTCSNLAWKRVCEKGRLSVYRSRGPQPLETSGEAYQILTWK